MTVRDMSRIDKTKGHKENISDLISNIEELDKILAAPFMLEI